MRVPWSWLSEFLDLPVGPEELAERLTRQGVAVEALEKPFPSLPGVVVGRIRAVERRPELERLYVCRVEAGKELLTIVCGAPNVREGLLCAVALPGTVLPGGQAISRRLFRGVPSEGMILSAREMGLPDPTGGTGILELGGDFPPGTPVAGALGLEDTVLVLDLTPNYAAHCQSVLGVAREALLALRDLLPPEARRLRMPPVEERPLGEEGVPGVTVVHPHLSSRYVGLVVEGVRWAPAPYRMQLRLQAAGIRPISNIVDVTNYVLLELGQPLHAFDRGKLRGGVEVRLARPGERILCLDGQERELEAEDLVIADQVGPVAIAGVMGGEETGVGEETQAVFLEAAHFSPESIRRTSRRLGLRTESSLRFERWVDPDITALAARRAARLLEETAGGSPRGMRDERPVVFPRREIEAREDFIRSFLGAEIPREEAREILALLGLGVEEREGRFLVTVPSWRPDLSLEVDLAEELARAWGYDRIPAEIPPFPVPGSPPSPRERFEEEVRRFCLGAGLWETVTYSFTGPRSLRLFGSPPAIALSNPLREEHSLLRPLLLPSLLEVADHNFRVGERDFLLFEVGRVYLPPIEGMGPRTVDRGPVEERRHLAFLLGGRREPPHWSGGEEEADFFSAKGILEELGERLGVELSFRPASPPGFHPGRAAEVFFGERRLGVVGELDPEAGEAFDLPPRVQAAELDLDLLFELLPPHPGFRPLPRFPAVHRDISFAVPRETPYEVWREAVLSAGGPCLVAAHLFDVYEGPPVPPEYRNLAFSLRFQSEERSLTDEEVERWLEELRAALRRKGALLRS